MVRSITKKIALAGIALAVLAEPLLARSTTVRPNNPPRTSPRVDPLWRPPPVYIPPLRKAPSPSNSPLNYERPRLEPNVRPDTQNTMPRE